MATLQEFSVVFVGCAFMRTWKLNGLNRVF